VTIRNLDTQVTRNTATDGGGFYGAVDLPPDNIW
jgi:predicted outer membrane repeat protein